MNLNDYLDNENVDNQHFNDVNNMIDFYFFCDRRKKKWNSYICDYCCSGNEERCE